MRNFIESRYSFSDDISRHACVSWLSCYDNSANTCILRNYVKPGQARTIAVTVFQRRFPHIRYQIRSLSLCSNVLNYSLLLTLHKVYRECDNVSLSPVNFSSLYSGNILKTVGISLIALVPAASYVKLVTTGMLGLFEDTQSHILCVCIHQCICFTQF